jgi:hypothetical protein
MLVGIVSAAPVDIPFRLHQGMILVDATMDGAARRMNFILDSGADETVLGNHVAEELGLILSGRERVRTVRGATYAGRAEHAHIRLGASAHPLRFSPRPLVIELARESRALGTRIDGLLGADFFQGRTIRIDFKRSRLLLSPETKPGPRAVRLPLLRRDGAMFVGMKAAGLALPRVRLDTGCRRSLCWSPPDGSSLRGFWRDGKTIKVDVHFGPLAMSEIPTDVYRVPIFAGEDGLLGTGLLSRFDSIWIDSVRRQISFEASRN